MSLFVVLYDERAGQNYAPLIAELETFANWWHCLDSTWIIETDLLAAALRDQLWAKMNSGDKLLVLNYVPYKDGGGHSAWRGFTNPAVCGEWLKANM